MRSSVTIRQRQVLRLVSLGKESTEIAEALGIKPQTARSILSAAYRRLGAANAAQAVRCCYERGIFTTGEGG